MVLPNEIFPRAVSFRVKGRRSFGTASARPTTSSNNIKCRSFIVAAHVVRQLEVAKEFQNGFVVVADGQIKRCLTAPVDDLRVGAVEQQPAGHLDRDKLDGFVQRCLAFVIGKQTRSTSIRPRPTRHVVHGNKDQVRCEAARPRTPVKPVKNHLKPSKTQ